MTNNKYILSGLILIAPFLSANANATTLKLSGEYNGEDEIDTSYVSVNDESQTLLYDGNAFKFPEFYDVEIDEQTVRVNCFYAYTNDMQGIRGFNTECKLSRVTNRTMSDVQDENSGGGVKAFNKSGNEIQMRSIDLYQDPSSMIIYHTDGRLFKLSGDYKAFDDNGEFINKNCEFTYFQTDHNEKPRTDVEYPGEECKLIELGASSDINITTELLSDSKVLKRQCRRYSGYAPPLVWSPYSVVGGHFGRASFDISVRVIGDTRVNSKVIYYQPDGWYRAKFFNQNVKIRTANVVGNIEISNKGNPLGSSVEVTVC